MVKNSPSAHPDDQFEPGWDNQEGIPDPDEFETLQDWKGQEKGEIKGTVSKVEQITGVKGRLEENVEF